MEVRYRAPAKINWTLAVKRRRPDGFHEIDTVLQAVSLYDRLIVVARRRPSCLILSSDPAVPRGPANLIHRAWRLLHEAYPRRVGGVVVDLEKAIPIGAGLGGGSSDAAATLAAVSTLYGLRITRARLEALAAGIGSDVPFFIRGGTARARGRGERIERIPARMRPLHLVIVWPGFASPTGPAYNALTPDDFERRSTAPAAARALAAGSRRRLESTMKNTFDPALARLEPRYAEVRDAMREAGLRDPMLAGSGSSLFAVARDHRRAAEAQARLSMKYPCTYAVRTLRTGVEPDGE